MARARFGQRITHYAYRLYGNVTEDGWSDAADVDCVVSHRERFPPARFHHKDWW